MFENIYASTKCTVFIDYWQNYPVQKTTLKLSALKKSFIPSPVSIGYLWIG